MSWKIRFVDPAGRPAESTSVNSLETALRYALTLQQKQGCTITTIGNLDGTELAGPALEERLGAMQDASQTELSLELGVRDSKSN